MLGGWLLEACAGAVKGAEGGDRKEPGLIIFTSSVPSAGPAQRRRYCVLVEAVNSSIMLCYLDVQRFFESSQLQIGANYRHVSSDSIVRIQTQISQAPKATCCLFTKLV